MATNHQVLAFTNEEDALLASSADDHHYVITNGSIWLVLHEDDNGDDFIAVGFSYC